MVWMKYNLRDILRRYESTFLLFNFLRILNPIVEPAVKELLPFPKILVR